MRSPAKMRVIQIEITNACPKRCSNCTRLIGHYKKPFFMDFEFFKKAVDSLVDFPGMVGIMGGEPTVHPKFKKLLSYYKKKVVPKKRRGLWTSLSKQYFENFELIKDVFGYECLNDHETPSSHQPILIAAKDVIKDENLMWNLIDNCWIQNLWSASITPKGAFFCEVAAAMDMIFDGPGGWPVGSDWWKRVPSDKDFQEQVKRWCPNCGAAIPLERRGSSDIVDDISISNLKRFKKIDSPKVKRGDFVLFDHKNYHISKYLSWSPSHRWYVKSESNRISEENKIKIFDAYIKMKMNKDKR